MKKTATIYRMHTDKHICPYGLKSLDLLKREGFEIEDHKLSSREETDDFKKKHNVKTTPQIFIDDERIGGFEDLQKHFGKANSDKEKTTYTPIIAIFSMTFLMALALSFSQYAAINWIWTIEAFIALSMCTLAVQKLRDLNSFSLQFITYDLIAMRYVPYAYVYAFLEAFAGIGMLAGAPAWLVATPALFIGIVGGVSVFKAVYIDKRELKCACVGGDSNVPLGFVSLTENIMMVAMATWMFIS